MSELSRNVEKITDTFDNYALLLGRYAAEMKKTDENSYYSKYTGYLAAGGHIYFTGSGNGCRSCGR